MVAIGFKQRFVGSIRVGLGLPNLNGFGVEKPGILPKRHTIRAGSVDADWTARGPKGRRLGRKGDELQLYCGMRTKECFLIGRARCVEARDIVLTFEPKGCVAIGGHDMPRGKRQRMTIHQGVDGLDEFARADGFDSWTSLVFFFKKEHGDAKLFIGVLIEWEPMT